MKKAELKQGTHVVIKIEDAEKYLDKLQLIQFKTLFAIIDMGRVEDGKDINTYYVVNTDEPYADEVLDLILTMEYENENS